MESRTEHHKFYLADFRREEAWLNEQNDEGWYLVDTDGATYTFEKGVKEQWIYRTDDIKPTDDPTHYMDKYEAKGWRFVCRTNTRVYMKRQRVGKEFDTSVFTEDKQRLEDCKVTIDKQMYKMTPLYIVLGLFTLAVIVMVFSRKYSEGVVVVFSTLAVIATLIFSTGISVHSGERKRWKKVKSELENGQENTLGIV